MTLPLAPGSRANLLNPAATKLAIRGFRPRLQVSSTEYDPHSSGTLEGWWDFSDLTTLFQDSTATTPVTADADPIGCITDKSGNGRDCVQATNGSRPTFKTAIVNNLSISRYNASHFLKASPFTLNQPTTIFAVGAFTNPAGLNRAMFDGNAFGDQMFDLVTGPQYRIYAGGNQQGGTADSSWHYFTARFNGVSSFLRVDGSVIIGPAVNAGSANASGFTIGARGNGAGQLIGDIAELLVYSEALDSSKIAEVESYLSSKWDL